MNLVELELDETLADFEVQDWIDNVFSVQYPGVKARIKKGCSGLCHKKDEWHYVSKGELPETSGKYLVFTGGEPFMLDYDTETKNFGYWCLDVGDNFGVRDTIFETITELDEDKVIAWKEIVLPKEIKEK